MKKILAIFFLLSSLLFSQGISVPKSFMANFTQIVKNPKGKVIKYRGKIFFNAPSETKWIYTSPTKKEVCSSGNNLVVIDHDLEQVSYYSIDKGLNLAKVLNRAKLHKNRTYVTKYKNNYYTIVLSPSAKIEQIAYKDNLDNQVNIIFTNTKYYDKLLPPTKFICARPKGYDAVY
jgi:outer membrane lipoprotein carrier protein